MSIRSFYDNIFNLSNEVFSGNESLDEVSILHEAPTTKDIPKTKDHPQEKKPTELLELSDTHISHKKENKKIRRKWTKEEDEILSLVVMKNKSKKWKAIADCLKDRTPIQCLHRWCQILKPGLIKGHWTIEEDQKLKEWVTKNGPTLWTSCAETIPGRSGKQCRERWFNSLNPLVKKGKWTIDEDYMILILYSKYGGKWSKIASQFEGRTENSIKNRFYSNLRRLIGECQNINKNMMISISKLRADELIKYLPLAIETTSIMLMKEKKMSKDALKQYEYVMGEYMEKNEKKNLSKVIGNSNRIYPQCQVSISQSPLTIGEPPLMNYGCMDLDALEREIYDMCDNSALCAEESNLLDIDDKLDNIIDGILTQNNIQVVKNPTIPCSLCKVNLDQWKNKGEIVHSLLDQLNNLENLVKTTKQELFKVDKLK